MTAVAHRGARRAGTARWVVSGLVAIVGVAALGLYLTGGRPGGQLDPSATGPDGAHAVVTLLRERGIRVVAAETVADVQREARPDALLLIAQTARIADVDLLHRLAAAPGDRLLLAPVPRAREILAPAVRAEGRNLFTRAPDCTLRAAERAGRVDLGGPQTYVAADSTPVESCYAGALVRYRTASRTITVVGDGAFLTNAGLSAEGNAALAMNLAGSRPLLIWYAPQRSEGAAQDTASAAGLVPAGVRWLVVSLCLAVGLAAVWQGRRLGPLVAERLPVVVRGSETVEGLGRLYRSRRARDRAAQALRIALVQRVGPRLGLSAAAPPQAVITTIAQRIGAHPQWLAHTLFGPPPNSDTDLLQLAHALDDIERQVTGP